MLAHDMRGALQGVLGGIAQIDAGALTPGAREQVERISAASKTLACLVGAMVGEQLDPEVLRSHARVDLPRFVRYLRRRFAGEARGKGLHLVIEEAARLPAELNLDLVPLGRVLCNLLGNAIKYTETGTVRLEIAGAPDGGVAFRLTDDGPGLATDVLDNAFRYGYRPRGANKPGTGLGLHIVKALSERIGGRITVGNRAGGGTEAVLAIPGELCVAEASPSPADPAPRASLAGLRVLLAEDNPTNQMVATQMLRTLEAEVTVCSDGLEALERFEEANFDLVVVDIEMPRMSGLDVIRTIRSRGDARARVPIVALTAFAMREHRDRIAEAGGSGLISKPITSIEAFGRGLAAHVGHREPAPAVRAAEPEVAPGEVVDLAVFEALSAAIGAETMLELLDKVVADLESAGADLAGALPTLDRGPIRSASHILISVAGALGANRLQGCARRLNAAAHSGEDDGIADELRLCLWEIDAAVAFARERRGAS